MTEFIRTPHHLLNLAYIRSIDLDSRIVTWFDSRHFSLSPEDFAALLTYLEHHYSLMTGGTYLYDFDADLSDCQCASDAALEF